MAKGRQVFRALLRLGWVLIRQNGSHRTLHKEGFKPLLFAYHDSQELGKVRLAQIAKQAGCQPEDLN